MTVYLLQDFSIVEEPLFEGIWIDDYPSLLGTEYFSHNLRQDFHISLDAVDGKRVFEVPRLAKKWKRKPTAKYRAIPYDFFDRPAVFSKRAVDTLGDLLKKNGELLPIQTTSGEYFAFNLLTVADVLDASNSNVSYSSHYAGRADRIERFSFREKRLDELAIFRIPEQPNEIYVTQQFVDTVESRGLNGFYFVRVFPFAKNRNWNREQNKLLKQMKRQSIIPNCKDAQQDAETFIIILEVAGKKPSTKERKQIDVVEQEIRAQLWLTRPGEKYFGSLKGVEYYPNECQIFITGPSANALASKFDDWLPRLGWSGDYWAIKRYGGMYDAEAIEEPVI